MYKKEAMIDIRKIPVAAAVLIICALLSGCRQEQTEPERTSSDYVYHSSVTSSETQQEEESATAEETTLTEETTETAASATAPAVTRLVTVPVTLPSTVPAQQPTETAPTTSAPQTEAPKTEKATSAAFDPTGEVDLSIVMPEANGKMQVDPSPDNRFVQKIADAKGIAAERLAAVYSVPDNGQNYVFEFTSESSRTVNDLRRVFLVDSDGNIQSVASSDSSLKVNLSPTENWFCMNVLIKGVIFPAIKDQF